MLFVVGADMLFASSYAPIVWILVFHFIESLFAIISVQHVSMQSSLIGFPALGHQSKKRNTNHALSPAQSSNLSRP